MTPVPSRRLKLARRAPGAQEGAIITDPAVPPDVWSGFDRHGGRLHAAMRRWPHAPRPWIDLSTGVNPLAYRAPRATAAERARLPDPAWLAGLEALAARAFGVEDGARVAALAGAEAALRLVPLALGARRVAIAGPTYGGHAEAWTVVGGTVLPWPEAEDVADAVVVVNPNNPDGRIMDLACLLALAERLARRGGWLVVDESFVEASAAVSLAPAAHPAVVVLRSFGKIYGLAGLRLGFVVAEPAMAARFRRMAGDWPVSADALAAGFAAYADPAWLARARRRLGRGAAELDRALAAAGYEIVGGASLFRLARASDAGARFEALCARGVLSRPFDWDATLLRFGLPHPRARRRVALALAAGP